MSAYPEPRVIDFIPHVKADAATSLLVEDSHSVVPAAPSSLEELGVSQSFLSDLVLKALALDPTATAAQIAQRLHLGLLNTDTLLQKLSRDKLIEIKGVVAAHNHRYAMLERGWAEVLRLLGTNNYIGVAPVKPAEFVIFRISQMTAGDTPA